MWVGMGTVFAFLTALVVAISAMSALVMRWQPVTEPLDATSTEADERTAAIAGALALHRSRGERRG